MKKFLPCIVLLIVAVAYAPTLTAGFVNWDDDIHLYANPIFQAGGWPAWEDIWLTTINHTYIPLTTLSWSVEKYFLGLNPAVYHLDNLLMHLMVTLLVIVFSRQLGLSLMAANLAGLIFGLHPMHVESVAWVTERKDVLYALFFMLSLITYLRYVDSGRWRYFWLALLCGVLSVLAKSMALSLPLVWLLIDWYRGRQIIFSVLAEKVWCVLAVVPVALITFFPNSALMSPAGGGVLLWVWCGAFYLVKFVVCWPLTLFYQAPIPISWQNPEYIVSAALLAVVVLAMCVFRRHRLVLWAFLFYMATAFFLFRFKPNMNLVADRFMYLPSAGICMLAAVLVEAGCLKLSGYKRYGWVTVVTVVLLTLGALTWRQCLVWQNSQALWQHQLIYNPQMGAWWAYYKLAKAFQAERLVNPGAMGINREAALYQQSMILNPKFAESAYELGLLWYEAGDRLKAERYFAEALRRDPSHPAVKTWLERLTRGK